MPVRKVKLKDGSIGYQWGTTGKIYKKREDAEKQGIAILLSQRKKRKMKISRQTYNELKDRLNKLEKLVNGGEGSGNFGHAGRPGKIGGSAPEGETSKKEAPKNPVKEVDAQISKLDEVEKELSKDTSIGATPALMDKIYVTDGDKKLAKKLGADVEVSERWAEQIASEKGYLRTRQMTTGFDFPIRERFDYDQLFKFSPEHALEIRRAFWDSVKDQLENE